MSALFHCELVQFFPSQNQVPLLVAKLAALKCNVISSHSMAHTSVLYAVNFMEF